MWTRVTYQFPDDSPGLDEELTSQLFSCGAKGVEVRHISEYLDDESDPARLEVVAFFPPDVPPHNIVLPKGFLSQLAFSEAEYVDIATVQSPWMKKFPPVQLSQHVGVVRSWHQIDKQKAPPVVLIIDPAGAFGEGCHDTTKLCAGFLDDVLTANPARRVLDIGCGTGILTMAAAHLGAAKVVGIDVSERAVTVASGNWQLNELGPAETAPFQPIAVSQVDGFFNVVVANLRTHLLLELRDELVHRLAEGPAVAVLGGIEDTEVEDVIAAYVDDRIGLSEVRHQGGWASILFSAD